MEIIDRPLQFKCFCFFYGNDMEEAINKWLRDNDVTIIKWVDTGKRSDLHTVAFFYQENLKK